MTNGRVVASGRVDQRGGTETARSSSGSAVTNGISVASGTVVMNVAALASGAVVTNGQCIASGRSMASGLVMMNDDLVAERLSDEDR